MPHPTGPGRTPPPPRAPAHPPLPFGVDRVRTDLLEWFAARGRRLPGRESRDPWRILVVEVMSQQTQIERCLTAAETFCARFPTATALADAPPADVIRAWSGLGYNRRALALRAAARAIVRVHGGQVPAGLAELLALPGVGPYTARAVAARAFGLPVCPLDVNVRRVLGRVAGEGAGTETTQALGDALVSSSPPDPSRPGIVADALMDLGALVCRPRQPACAACPLAPSCASAHTPDLADPRAAHPSRPSQPFVETRRWLRGTLLRELGRASAGTWNRVEGDRGAHGQAAVHETLAEMAAEGFLELDELGRARLAQ